jgi:murein DD-endopeptidase MepM/ murein hydrolase activator NlpD
MKLGRFGAAGPETSARPGERWSLEVQIHPSDIRKRVRYLFLPRWKVTLWAVPALLWVLGVALAVAVAPGVVAGQMSRQEYRSLSAERSRQGERLQALLGRLDTLDRRGVDLHLRLDKVFLAYGLPPVRPTRPTVTASRVPVPDSIYAAAVEQGDRLRERLRGRLREVDGDLREVGSFETSHAGEVRTTPSICPLRGKGFVLISSFGDRRSPFTRQLEFHPGVDLAAPVGTPVFAPADGVVVFAGQYPLARSHGWWSYGNMVLIRDGEGFVTIFGHADRVEVRAGQRIRRGERLATVGNTGWSTSPHLHYEVRRRGADGVFRPIDPLLFILDRHWPNDDRLLLKARNARPVQGFEPLPPGIEPQKEKSR